MSPPPRLTGIDLARFLAIAGMVVVHAATDLVLLPIERADPAGVTPPLPPGPEWAVVLQELLTNRARPLFILLAGVGVSLLVRRTGAGAGTLVRRALFLGALGVLLVLVGWSDIVLVFYGVVFLLAVLLVRLPSPLLVVAAGLLAALPWPLLAVDASRDDTLTNVLVVLSETAFFAVGLVVGRLRLDAPTTGRRLAVVGAVLALTGLVPLAVRGALDITEVDSWWELAAASVSTAGLALVVVAGCLAVGRGGAATRAMVGPLVVAGSMPLTVYVAHALLFSVLSRTVTVTLASATAVASAYLVLVVVVATWWSRRGHRGPVEELMRRLAPAQPPSRRTSPEPSTSESTRGSPA